MNPRNLLSPHRWRLDRVGLVVILLACANAGVVVQARNWPGWRGPTGTGHRTEVIVRAGPKFELVAVNNLGGGDAQCGPSAAVSNGRIFVRDFEFLYCLGIPDSEKQNDKSRNEAP